MNKIMKKLLTVGLLALGLIVFPKSKAQAGDWESSTWTARFMAYVSSVPTSVSTFTAGGIAAGGSFDVLTITVSSGNPANEYFVCVDSLPLSASGIGAYNLANFPPEQYIFPPVVVSCPTVGGYGAYVSFAKTYDNSGRTVVSGLTCFLVGAPAGERRVWSIETAITPRRERP